MKKIELEGVSKNSSLAERKDLPINLLKGKNLWICGLILIIGIYLNYTSQEYLHFYTQSGKSLPVLSDLVLNNLPYIDIDFVYESRGHYSIGIFSGVLFAYATKTFVERHIWPFIHKT
jgi:hypothetical protein